MPTISSRAVQEALNERFSDEQDGDKWMRIVHRCLRQFAVGEYPSSYQDMIFQKWERFSPTIYDAYAFACIHNSIKQGEIALFSVKVSDTPHRDRDIDGNNSVLRRLPHPYTAEFVGGTQDADGVFGWSEPVHGIVCYKNEQLGCFIPPMDLPLEVGTCESDKMYLYTAYPSGIGVARWPYYCDRIFVMTNRFFGESDARFQDTSESIGESLEQFAYDENRNPWIEWGKHVGGRA